MKLHSLLLITMTKILLLLMLVGTDPSCCVWSFAVVNVQRRPMTTLPVPTTISGNGRVIGSTSSCTTATTPTYLSMTKLVYNGKAKDFAPGTPLSKAVSQLGVPVKYSCKKYVSSLF